jgi:hypothetical protein
MLVALLGCQEKSEKAPEPPKIVEVRDDHAATVARIQAGPPCRATFGGSELVVDAKSSLESAGVKWTTEERGRDWAILKDGQLFARIVDSDEDRSAGHTEVIDPHGVAIVRVNELHQQITVANAGGVRLRAGAGLPLAIGGMTITGTNDLRLAALVASPEVAPEVRALFACNALSRGGA